MKKAEIIKLTDLLSFIGLLTLISTGVLLEFTLPPRSGGASIWGLTRHDWGDIHFYTSVIFLLLMSVHLFLHFNFIKKAITGRASREQNYRLAIGVASFIVLVILLASPLVAPIEDQERKRGGKYYEQNRK